MSKRTRKAPAFFLACLCPLLAADVLRTGIMYYYSVDRGFWPLFLGLMMSFNVVFSTCSFAVARARHYSDTLTALRFHAVLACVLVGQTLTFYLVRPDWLAVNNGLRSLTLLERAANSDLTICAIYIVALALWTVRSIKRNVMRPDER